MRPGSLQAVQGLCSCLTEAQLFIFIKITLLACQVNNAVALKESGNIVGAGVVGLA